jgi:hypothetical protein
LILTVHGGKEEVFVEDRASSDLRSSRRSAAPDVLRTSWFSCRCREAAPGRRAGRPGLEHHRNWGGLECHTT